MKNASLMSSDISQNRITVTCNYPRLHPGNNNWRLNYHIIIIKKQKKKNIDHIISYEIFCNPSSVQRTSASLVCVLHLSELF